MKVEPDNIIYIKRWKWKLWKWFLLNTKCTKLIQKSCLLELGKHYSLSYSLSYCDIIFGYVHVIYKDKGIIDKTYCLIVNITIM